MPEGKQGLAAEASCDDCPCSKVRSASGQAVGFSTRRRGFDSLTDYVDVAQW